MNRNKYDNLNIEKWCRNSYATKEGKKQDWHVCTIHTKVAKPGKVNNNGCYWATIEY